MSNVYLEFSEIDAPKGYVTKIWDVKSKSSATLLGIVRWYSKWRCYCFMPKGDTIWSPGCLKQVEEFSTLQTAKRKVERMKGTISEAS